MGLIDRYRGALLGLACGAAGTTAAIVGQVTGAHYGVDSIPAKWLDKLHLRAQIELLADRLLRLSHERG